MGRGTWAKWTAVGPKRPLIDVAKSQGTRRTVGREARGFVENRGVWETSDGEGEKRGRFAAVGTGQKSGANSWLECNRLGPSYIAPKSKWHPFQTSKLAPEVFKCSIEHTISLTPFDFFQVRGGEWFGTGSRNGCHFDFSAV